MSALSVEPQRMAVFRVADLHFGVPVEKVQEVLRFQEMTRVPLASPAVGGLINLRGEIVTAIDLRVRLGLPGRAPETRPMNVVLRTDTGAVSLLVDEIGDVLELGEESRERLPPTVTALTRELVRGVYKLAGQLLLVLDVGRALEAR